MSTSHFKIINNADDEVRIRLIKKTGATVDVKPGDNPTFQESSMEVGFCLAGNSRLLTDEDGNILSGGDDNVDLII